MGIKVFAALLFGMVAGLVPGLHINTIAKLMAEEGLRDLIPLAFGVYIPLTAVPFFLLSVGEGGNVVGLPAVRKVMKEGKGGVAFSSVLYSTLISAVLSLAFYFLFPSALKVAYERIREWLGFIVMGVILGLVMVRKEKLKFLAVFLASGIMGILSFETLRDPFFPMFAGFFALPLLLKSKSVGQIRYEEASIGGLIPSVLLGAFLGFSAVLLPGISSPSVMLTLAGGITVMDSVSYLSATYGFMAAQGFYAFVSYGELEKPRVGAVAYAKTEEFFLYLIGIAIGVMVSRAVIHWVRDMERWRKPIALLLIGMAGLEGMWGLTVLTVAFLLSVAAKRIDVPGVAHLGSVALPVLMFHFF